MRLKDVYRHTGLLYGVNLASSIVTFAIMILVTRWISKADMGSYGLFQAYFFVAAYATGLGVNQTLVKTIAERNTAPAQLHALLASVLGAIVLVCAVVGAALWYFEQYILAAVVLTLPAYHAFDFSLSYCRGHLWKVRESLILLGSSLATSAAIVVCTHYWPDWRGPVIGQVTSFYFIAAVVVALFFRMPVDAGRFARPQGEWLKRFAFTAGPIFATAALFSFGEVADRFMIEHFLGREVLAEYFLAMAFLNILDKPIGLLSRVLLSHFSQATHATDAGARHAAVGRLVQLNTLVFPVFALAVVVLLPHVLSQFFNKDYSRAFDILAVISAIMVIKAFEVVNSSLAIAKDEARSNLRSQIVSLVVYLPLALLLLKVAGIFGVAVAIALRWLTFTWYQFARLERAGVDTVSRTALAKALLAYLTALALYPEAPWLSLPAYVACGFALRLWSIDDFARLMPWLRTHLLPSK